jgi:hypothetical protein
MIGNRDREDDKETRRTPGGSGLEKKGNEVKMERTRSQGLPGNDNRELDEELRGQLRNKNEQSRRNMRGHSGRSEMQDTD